MGWTKYQEGRALENNFLVMEVMRDGRERTKHDLANNLNMPVSEASNALSRLMVSGDLQVSKVNNANIYALKEPM